ncbi:MAG: flagellar hook-associated protein 3 [Betaproteobacteria bacterium TMED156]|nr:MAG: flagellar hook-associated protein 3 [Betaproteobacteria bacterium TMED156]
MKISTALFFDRSVDQMVNSQSNLAETQTKLSSGKNVVNPSDAPDKATAIQRVKSVIKRQESFEQNIQEAQNRLIAEETALNATTDVLTRIKELAIQAANGTLGPKDRELVAVEIQGLSDDLMSLANTQDVNDNYVFSGTRVETKPFEKDPLGNVEYAGDETRNRVQVGEQRMIRFNRTGTDVFGRVVREHEDGSISGTGFFDALKQLAEGIRKSDQKSMDIGINDLDQASFNISLATAQVGTEMAVVETQKSVNEETVLQLKTALSAVEDLDYSAAVTEMQKNMLALQATQSSFSRISALSLFNYLS